MGVAKEGGTRRGCSCLPQDNISNYMYAPPPPWPSAIRTASPSPLAGDALEKLDSFLWDDS